MERHVVDDFKHTLLKTDVQEVHDVRTQDKGLALAQDGPWVFRADLLEHLYADVIHVFKTEGSCSLHSLAQVLHQVLPDQVRDVCRIDVHQCVKTLRCKD